MSPTVSKTKVFAEVKTKDLIKSADENMYKNKEESKENEVLA